MANDKKELLGQVALLCFIAAGLYIVWPEAPIEGPAVETQVSAIAAPLATTSESTEPEPEAALPEPETAQKPSNEAIIEDTSISVVPTPEPEGAVHRIVNPYATPPLSFDTINVSARSALVNILCIPYAGSLKPITGSGVIVSSTGIILTNAHVAQYVLLSQANTSVTCTIRMGSPAQPRFVPHVLYVPSDWIEQHASDIVSARPVGTGEKDYALLFPVRSIDGSAAPADFPYLSIDTRERIGFTDDAVLVASYPAEFLAGFAAYNNLYSASSVTTIKKLLTFETNTVDVHSLGGIIGAQSGSSGGAVVNGWGYLIGIVSTMADGKTTADRDLRSVTLSYIDRDIRAETGSSLADILSGDPLERAVAFAQGPATALVQLLIDAIEHR